VSIYDRYDSPCVTSPLDHAVSEGAFAAEQLPLEESEVVLGHRMQIPALEPTTTPSAGPKLGYG
jgi:hypothetical protein